MTRMKKPWQRKEGRKQRYILVVVLSMLVCAYIGRMPPAASHQGPRRIAKYIICLWMYRHKPLSLKYKYKKKEALTQEHTSCG